MNGDMYYGLILIPLWAAAWAGSGQSFQGTPDYLLLIDVPLEFVQSREGFVVHFEFIAGSSGEHLGCDVTLSGESTVTDSTVSRVLTW